jgi:Neuraminidase (sialidase)
MKEQKKQDIEIKLCVDCFNCKTRRKQIYCKLGVWKEDDNGSTILHTPYDFNCPKWEEA